MSLGTICRSLWVRAGLGTPVPGAWATNADIAAVEVVEFVREATRLVYEAAEWQALVKTREETITGAPAQTVALPSDFGRMVPDTLWNVDTQERFTGPLTDEDYEALRVDPARAAIPVFRISGGALDLMTAFNDAATIRYRYVQNTPVRSAGGASMADWMADTDTSILDERVILLGALLLWRDAKGLPAEVANAQYLTALARAKAHDRPIGVMDMSRSQRRMGDKATGNVDFIVDVDLLG